MSLLFPKSFPILYGGSAITICAVSSPKSGVTFNRSSLITQEFILEIILIALSMISFDEICKSSKYRELINRYDQLDFYKDHGASDAILQLVRLNSKSYGAVIEDVVLKRFGISHTLCTEQDGVFEGTLIEVKGPRLTAKGDFFVQHLKPTHNYDLILVAVLEPTGSLTVRAIKKWDALRFAKKQGSEGFIVQGKTIVDYGRIVTNADDLRAFIQCP